MTTKEKAQNSHFRRRDQLDPGNVQAAGQAASSQDSAELNQFWAFLQSHPAAQGQAGSGGNNGFNQS